MTGFLRSRSPASLPCQCPHSRGRPSIALIQRWSVPAPQCVEAFVVNGSKIRRSIISVTTLAVVGLTTAVGLQQAQAATIGGFEIDGNIQASTATDWSNTAITQPIDSDDHVGNPDSTIYTGGSKEDDPAGWKVTASGQPPAKDDVGYVYAWAHRVNGHEFAY